MKMGYKVKPQAKTEAKSGNPLQKNTSPPVSEKDYNCCALALREFLEIKKTSETGPERGPVGFAGANLPRRCEIWMCTFSARLIMQGGPELGRALISATIALSDLPEGVYGKRGEGGF